MNEFAMGEEGCDGLVVGIKIPVQSVKSGTPIEYRIAWRNQTQQPRQLILFSDNEAMYRTRLLIESAHGTVVRGAVIPPVPTLSGLKVSVQIGPGETHERDAKLVLPADTRGDVTLILVYGGTPTLPSEVRSAPVKLHIQ